MKVKELVSKPSKKSVKKDVKKEVKKSRVAVPKTPKKEVKQVAKKAVYEMIEPVKRSKLYSSNPKVQAFIEKYAA